MKPDNQPSQGFEQDFRAVAHQLIEEAAENLGSRLFAVMELKPHWLAFRVAALQASLDFARILTLHNAARHEIRDINQGDSK